jgi:hypothetical protein
MVEEQLHRKLNGKSRAAVASSNGKQAKSKKKPKVTRK